MRETEYAYAVARIRANENSLLTHADFEQLINCASHSEALRFLADKGWSVPDGGKEFDIPEKEIEKAWELICECVPDKTLLEALIIGNDFSNLKAAIKAVFSNRAADEYYTYPCVADTAAVNEAIKTKNFELLPEYLRSCADEAYDCLTRLESGQLAEIAIDKASLNTRLDYASKSGSDLLIKVTRLQCAVANIKIAIRSAAMGKAEDFAKAAMCESDALDWQVLLEAAYAEKPLADILANTELEILADCVDKDFTALEKTVDNIVVKWLEGAKYQTFGPDPVAAYYYAKQAEAKNVRIILSAKGNSLPAEAIHERVRDIYV